MPALEICDSKNKEYCLPTADNDWKDWHVFLTLYVQIEGGDAHLEFEVAGSAPSEFNG